MTTFLNTTLCSLLSAQETPSLNSSRGFKHLSPTDTNHRAQERPGIQAHDETCNWQQPNSLWDLVLFELSQCPLRSPGLTLVAKSLGYGQAIQKTLREQGPRPRVIFTLKIKDVCFPFSAERIWSGEIAPVEAIK